MNHSQKKIKPFRLTIAFTDEGIHKLKEMLPPEDYTIITEHTYKHGLEVKIIEEQQEQDVVEFFNKFELRDPILTPAIECIRVYNLYKATTERPIGKNKFYRALMGKGALRKKTTGNRLMFSNIFFTGKDEVWTYLINKTETFTAIDYKNIFNHIEPIKEFMECNYGNVINTKILLDSIIEEYNTFESYEHLSFIQFFICLKILKYTIYPSEIGHRVHF